MDRTIEITDKKATGAYTLSGDGYCLECLQSINIEEFSQWNYNGEITCDNCGKDTELKG